MKEEKKKNIIFSIAVGKIVVPLPHHPLTLDSKEAPTPKTS